MLPLYLGDSELRGYGGSSVTRDPLGLQLLKRQWEVQGRLSLPSRGAGLPGLPLSSAGIRSGSLDKTLHLSGFRFPQLSNREKHLALSQSCLLSQRC